MWPITCFVQVILYIDRGGTKSCILLDTRVSEFVMVWYTMKKLQMQTLLQTT